MQAMLREHLHWEAATIASAWALYSACTAATEVVMGIAVPNPGKVLSMVFQAAWAASVFLLWSPQHAAVVPGGMAGALCAHGVLHAFVALRYSALFSTMFPTDDSRSAAVSIKQQSVVLGLIAGTFGVSLLSGTAWVNVAPVAAFMGGAAALFSATGGVALALHSGAPVAAGSQALSRGATARQLATSRDFWVFVGVDGLSALANALITNSFPLLVAHTYGFSSDRRGVALGVGPWLPAATTDMLKGVLPGAAQLQQGANWDVLIPGAALLPCLYLVFYVAGAAAGPLWASAARMRWMAWKRLWQVGAVAYSIALYSVLGSRSYHGLLFQVALQGAMVCVFLVLPELFTGAVVDQQPTHARKQAAQMLTSAKAVTRRLGGAVQGAVAAAVLRGSDFKTAQTEPTEGTVSAIATLFAWYPIILLILSAVLVNWFEPGERLLRIVLGRRAVQKMHLEEAAAAAAAAQDENGEDVLVSNTRASTSARPRGVGGTRHKVPDS